MKQFVFFGILLSITAFLVIRSELRETPNIADQYVGERVEVVGTIIKDPDQRESQTRLVVETEKIASNPIQTKILVSTSPYREFYFGDQVSVTGKLRKPENFETDTGREFDYVSYLRKDDIYYQMSFVDISVLDQTSHTSVLCSLRAPAKSSHFSSHELICGLKGVYAELKKRMYALRKSFVQKIDQLYSQPEGALLAGVLFGEQSGLGNDLQDNFRRTGVIHIVVLSGFNVTIVAIFIVWLLSRIMKPRIALLFGIVGIILFVILVGAGATIVRAGIMAILAIIARLLGRDTDAGRALLIAALLMIMHNPKILLHDISFQLSFLATAGIIYVAPVLERALSFLPTALTFRETVVSTLSAQIFVLPLLLYKIGEFSIVSPLVNVLVVPLVPLSMLLGFISSLLGMISEPFGSLLMLPTYVILHIQIKIVEFFGSLQSAAVVVPEFPLWMVGVSYALLTLAFVFRKEYKNIY